MRLLLIYIASIALGLLASPSRATESFHCPEPGTVLSFTEGTVLAFTTQDSLTCRARSNKGALVAQFLGLAPAESRLRRPPEPSTPVVVEQEETGAGVQWAKRLYWYVPETGLIVKSTFTVLRSADRLTGHLDSESSTWRLPGGAHRGAKLQATSVTPAGVRSFLRASDPLGSCKGTLLGRQPWRP